MADPKKKQQQPHPSLLEKDDLLHGVRLEIARPPTIRSALSSPQQLHPRV
jgi:hypothetical protein